LYARDVWRAPRVPKEPMKSPSKPHIYHKTPPSDTHKHPRRPQGRLRWLMKPQDAPTSSLSSPHGPQDAPVDCMLAPKSPPSHFLVGIIVICGCVSGRSKRANKSLTGYNKSLESLSTPQSSLSTDSARPERGFWGVVGRLGGVLGRRGASWGVLGRRWGVLGRLRGVFGTSLGRLGACGCIS
jgi:hypothetical protein